MIRRLVASISLHTLSNEIFLKIAYQRRNIFSSYHLQRSRLQFGGGHNSLEIKRGDNRPTSVKD